MLQINCPYCGTRDEVEFVFGGESGVARPDPSVGDGEWAHYLFNRSNLKGLQRERWFHRFGCGQWFEVNRDTVTHDITAVWTMGASAPVVEK